MQIKDHYNQNVFTILEFYKLKIFDQNIFLEFLRKGKTYKSPSVIRFVVKALTHCSTILGNTILKEKDCKIILHFILFILKGLII